MTARTFLLMGSLLAIVGCAAAAPRAEPAPAAAASPGPGAEAEGPAAGEERGGGPAPGAASGAASGELAARDEPEPERVALDGASAGATLGPAAGSPDPLTQEPEEERPDRAPALTLDDPEERADLEAAAALADAFDEDPAARAVAARAAALRGALRARAASWLAARAPTGSQGADGLARAFLPYFSPAARAALAQEADLAAALAREHGALVGEELGVVAAEIEAVELGFDHARVRARVRWASGAEASLATVWVLLEGELYLKTTSDFGEPLELTGLAADR